jgi:hypothetical protein
MDTAHLDQLFLELTGKDISDYADKSRPPAMTIEITTAQDIGAIKIPGIEDSQIRVPVPESVLSRKKIISTAEKILNEAQLLAKLTKDKRLDIIIQESTNILYTSSNKSLLLEKKTNWETVSLPDFLHVHFNKGTLKITIARANASLKIVHEKLAKYGITSLLNKTIVFANSPEPSEKFKVAGRYYFKVDLILINQLVGVIDRIYTGFQADPFKHTSVTSSVGGRSTTRSIGYISIILHELGHRFHAYCQRSEASIPYEQTFDFYNSAMYNYCKQNKSLFPSNYSQTNVYEFWADSVRHTCTSLPIDPKLKKWTEALIQAKKHCI